MRLRDEILRGHGGRVDEAERLYPEAPTPWVDLSTGVSPHGYPVPAVDPEAYRRLPLGRDIAALAEAAAAAYGRPAGTALIPVAGSETAIRLLPLILGPRLRVGVVGRTYSSHAAAWEEAGAAVRPLPALPDPAGRDLDVAVLVNPNNPDGAAVARPALARFAEEWTAAGRKLIVDEAFADVAPDLSLLAADRLPDGVVVLRSLGKFFGLAGLRVGFVAVAERAAMPWRRRLGDWPVSGPACAVAAAALSDADWIATMRGRLAAERTRLEAVLAAGGLRIVGGTDLFVLAEGPAGIDLVDRFARAGILVRGFAHTPHRYRFGLPADEAGWERLDAACRSLAAAAAGR
ncbi:threonine-phosphate decarboxylase CobD [Rhodoplanes sp. TEM]|uniref:threonine-phosphate decarboxylase n=1 Tax=Rhodoplanes tepidamans TaxID=200616 RepID=A0ABT5J8G8_RHOTP|nr:MULTISPECIES: threonine-phosphate decarboxylase CobD [Rhodoplanes]MDC7785876.1 threonine-phosphate decarboxylase CobD [Rhodoplanes tepidamans]MDC7984988.1 threonine-phosphate decarboxylase CobD [Rhodoplanes sp. TEM]MDQ0355506.1 cobalamin biosynthetic protein CobC [Rhodoplanes tepidamans]